MLDFATLLFGGVGTMKTHFTYRGVVVFRNTEPHKLRWTARIDGVGQVAADTVAGIKQLIEESEQC